MNEGEYGDNIPTNPKLSRDSCMSRAHWKTSYLDESGNVRHIEDEKRTVSFYWVESRLGISRKTLNRHRIPFNKVDPNKMDGILRVYPKAPTLTRTDWVFHFIVTSGNQLTQ